MKQRDLMFANYAENYSQKRDKWNHIWKKYMGLSHVNFVGKIFIPEKNLNYMYYPPIRGAMRKTPYSFFAHIVPHQSLALSNSILAKISVLI